MVFAIFIIASVLFVSHAQAQYSWAIPCHTAQQCADVLGGSSQRASFYQCTEGYCLCANITTGKFEFCSNKDMILTATASGLRRNCTKHEDCTVVPGANCLPKDPKDKSNKICLCQLDRVESEDGQSCLPAVEVIGGQCKEPLQCISRLGEGAQCTDGKCECRPTHHHKNSKCIRNLGYGDNCSIEEDGCYEAATKDGDNLMTCTDNYGCRCKKYWTYNQERQHCEYSSASHIVVHTVTIVALISMIAYF